jgi:phage-related protein
MPVIAAGVRELRVKDATATVLVFYAIGQSDAIIVFHAFRKKSQKLPGCEIALGRRRLQEVLNAKSEF